MEVLNRKRYFAALKEGVLLGLKCRDCGEVTVPPKATCNHCYSRNQEVITLSGKGSIKTFTVIRVPPEGFEAPYIVALAELSEGPWLLGNLEGVPINDTGVDLLGKKISVSAKEVQLDNYTDTVGVTPVFTLTE
jgi:hypothetical protein